jgi:hypothetical protein
MVNSRAPRKREPVKADPSSLLQHASLMRAEGKALVGMTTDAAKRPGAMGANGEERRGGKLICIDTTA